MGVDSKMILKKRPCILIIAMALVKGYWLFIMQIQRIILPVCSPDRLNIITDHDFNCRLSLDTDGYLPSLAHFSSGLAADF